MFGEFFFYWKTTEYLKSNIFFYKILNDSYGVLDLKNKVSL